MLEQERDGDSLVDYGAIRDQMSDGGLDHRVEATIRQFCVDGFEREADAAIIRPPLRSSR